MSHTCNHVWNIARHVASTTSENNPWNGISKSGASHATLHSTQQWLTLALRLGFRCRPARQHKSDLVHEVGQVVHHVQESFINGTQQIAIVVSKRVDAPPRRHNDTHVVEGVFHGRRAISCNSTSFALEDLEQNVTPTCHAEEEANPSLGHPGLPCIPECKHHHCAKEKPPEALRCDRLLRCLQDQVEFNHLQWDSDTPIHIPVHDWGLVHLHPILTHVHVVNCSHQGDKRAHVKRCLPVIGHSLCLQHEEEGGCDHSNGDDPEGDGHDVMR